MTENDDLDHLDRLDDDDSSDWLCGCGHWEESDFHCSRCGAEPPWGCDCGAHEADDPDDDETWMEEVP